jgi:peptidoglycan-N-acetylglucosamine deacetylase
VSNRPLATLSLDLDNLWAYLKTKGDESWRHYPSYLNIFVPQALAILAERQLKITFFIVGQDATMPEHRDVLRQIALQGHEIANHSFHHDPCLSSLTKAEIEAEVTSAEEAIFGTTGVRPVGFRGPGFSWSPALFGVLAQRGYFYESTLFPTFIGPLARWYYSWRAQPSTESLIRRTDLFGSFKEGFTSLKPYRWCLEDNRSLLELPVTTMPWTRMPFHVSYLMALASLSPVLMRRYFKAALSACYWSNTSPHLLLHPTDLLGIDKARQLSFLPGMSLPSDRKAHLFKLALDFLQERFDIISMKMFAERLQGVDLPSKDLK